MNSSTAAALVQDRPEVEYALDETGAIAEVARPLSLWERVSTNAAVRRIFVLVIFGLAWELAARYSDNPLIFPSLSESLVALKNGILSGVLLGRIATSLEVLVLGYTVALCIALLLTIMAIITGEVMLKRAPPTTS